MPRPIKQVVDYFPHYASASNGRTMFILESQYGNDGYAFWFKVLELLSSTKGHYYDFNNPPDWEFLLAKTRVSDDIAKNILNTLMVLGAIDQDLYSNNVLWCQNLIDNLAPLYERRKSILPQKPLYREHKPQPVEVSTGNNSINSNQKPQSKGEESKGEESKGINKSKYGEFLNVFLSNEEYKKLTERFGEKATSSLIESLSCGISSKGYKYKSHYAAILNWDRMEKKRSEESGSNNSRKSQKTTDEARRASITHPECLQS